MDESLVDQMVPNNESISLNPESVLNTTLAIWQTEKRLRRKASE